MTEIIQDEIVSQRQLAIVERYEGFVNYTYPIMLNIRRAHGRVRDRVIDAMFEQVHLFIEAGKSSQISKLYMADAGLAALRFYLRFLADPVRKLISKKQHQVASVHLAETGNLLGAWIKNMRRKG